MDIVNIDISKVKSDAALLLGERLRRTVASTTSRDLFDAGFWTEEAPRRITDPAVANPRVRA